MGILGPHPRLVPASLALAIVVGLTAGPSHASPSPVDGSTAGRTTTVKIATIHFAPTEGDVAGNRAKLVDLATEAAQNGAKIIVLPEMATSGYSFFSRSEIATVAETVPGPSTQALGQIADQYDAYIAFGMPQYVPQQNLYFNVAVLLNPLGKVAGVYRKRNHLLESSYNAITDAPVPTFDTPYGRIALVICSDMFYSQFPRAAAVAGATLLLAPANVGIETDFVRLRTFENDFAMVVANRYGSGTAGTKPTAFTQDTFTIPSPYAYDFNYGSRSIIATHQGTILADLSAHVDAIGYGLVPVRQTRTFPVERRPGMYSLLAQDTLETYTQTQFKQPAATTFATAAVDPGPAQTPWAAAQAAAEQARTAAVAAGQTLRLVVFPANYFTVDAAGLASMRGYAQSHNLDLLVHYPATATEAPRSLLITSTGTDYPYVRTHRARSESIPAAHLSDDYWVIDRDYGRVALMQDVDMLPPETSHVLARMGVDVVAVNADMTSGLLSPLWQSRTGDYLHIAVANRSGPEGVYLGGYRSNPGFTQGEGQVIRDMDTSHIRKKPSARFFDYHSILKPCTLSAANC
ncbi:nitrilase-related carbon-nitrogen hydrolase [Micromonospora sp. CPCC 206060]|uniref:nitrilase-related carbon-nitrogen hydrolase n=1 Tax=Micromonospora sp. CPCC 206060 TaxID=3122406 RepID=UPI002FEF7740